MSATPEQIAAAEAQAVAIGAAAAAQREADRLAGEALAESVIRALEAARQAEQGGSR
ncbi:hypothetical protein ACFYN3_40610 [Streptomyces lavendulae]|uniref:hypothetical protein n=1 Tax=Streptomyces lavendulae TaxID=1914 RepID=UPI0036AB10CA